MVTATNAPLLTATVAAVFLLTQSHNGSAAERPRDVSISRIVSYLSGQGQRTASNRHASAATGTSFVAPTGNWAGTACTPADEMRTRIDEYLATPDPNFFPERGSTIPGLSASWSATHCGTFTYAAGLKQVEKSRALTPDTLMGIASMGKAVVAAMTLQLNERGAFGPLGLDTPVSQLLPSYKIHQLTVGDDALAPRCPGSTYLYNRVTFQYEWTSYTCPDLATVTLRALLLANHGMYDFLNEVLLPDGNWQTDENWFYELYQHLGIDAVPPVSASNGFDYLKAFGLKRYDAAYIGGTQGRDFEISLGNTGYQLMGVILEQVTGKSLDNLIHQLIVAPLSIDPIFVHLAAGQWENLVSSGYEAYTGNPLIEESGVYPLTSWHGHTLLNNAVLGLGKPANLHFAGGAGGFVANMPSYREFLDKFVNGGLLAPRAQAEFEASFVPVPDFSSPVVDVQVGFGLSKLKVTGSPVAPDNVLFWHGGSLPGVLCVNAVVRHHDTEQPLGAGSMCQNSHGSNNASIYDLWNAFITAVITSAAAAQ